MKKEIEDKEKSEEAVYLIKFENLERFPNCFGISNIDKTTFDEFVDYLYSLKRDIHVLTFVFGAMYGLGITKLDGTRDVKAIAEDIKNGVPKNELLNQRFVFQSRTPVDYANPFNLFFKEDVCEFLEKNTKLSKSNIRHLVADLPWKLVVEKDMFYSSKVFEDFNSWLTDNNGHKPWIKYSRWNFVYMFRSEFREFMDKKNYRVVVEGGWVLNSKQREVALGLIDKNGDLL